MTDGLNHPHGDIMATKEIFESQYEKYNDIPTDLDELASMLNDGLEKIDIAGKLVMKDSVVCFNFGKYKGHPVCKNQHYIEWMLNADFPADTKRKLIQFRH